MCGVKCVSGGGAGASIDCLEIPTRVRLRSSRKNVTHFIQDYKFFFSVPLLNDLFNNHVHVRQVSLIIYSIIKFS